MTPLFIGGIGMQEVLLIALVVLLFFGGKKIPELMKGIGKGVHSFKDGMNNIEKEIEEETKRKRNNRWRQKRTDNPFGPSRRAAGSHREEPARGRRVRCGGLLLQKDSSPLLLAADDDRVYVVRRRRSSVVASVRSVRTLR